MDMETIRKAAKLAEKYAKEDAGLGPEGATEYKGLHPVAVTKDNGVTFWTEGELFGGVYPISVYPDTGFIYSEMCSARAGRGWWSDDDVKEVRWRD